tara:strand:+ start:1731 stop:4439 length:2709 start_codon:yes stop_codon:yes gene_type:complete
VGLVYNTEKNDYVVTYEKTDYKTDFNVNRPIERIIKQEGTRDVRIRVKSGFTTRTEPLYIVYEIYPDGTEKKVESPTSQSGYAEMIGHNKANYNAIKYWNETTGKENKKENEKYAEINTANAEKNETNTALNSKFDKIITISNGTQGSDYLQRRSLIRDAISSFDSKTRQQLEDQFKEFYRDQKLKTWDTNLGTKPPYGTFDGTYYGKTYSGASSTWANAINDDNIDITERYGSANSYYLYHYTTRGKRAGNRGNPAEATAQANAYIEEAPTDKEIQQVRDKQLGVDVDTTTDRLLNIEYINTEWEKAKNGDPYWKQLAKDNYLDPENKDEFAALFRLSKRDEDKQIALDYNINLNYGITDLEDAINQATGEKAIVDAKKFGALAQDVLKETISEVKKAKAKEAEVDFLSGFGGFSEIMNINEELTNSLMGDSGIGGMLSFTGDREKIENSFEKSIGKLSGVDKNLASYNWQKWFDQTLNKRYDEALELGLTKEEAEEQIKIEKEFAESFVADYLNPRFNESKSMDEFIEYIDVRQEEKNPFQTQDMLDAVATAANLKADEFIRQIQKERDRYFDSNFYFDPTGNKAQEENYASQKADVNAAWTAAKTNANQLIDPSKPSLGTWAQQAYRFGLDLTNKENFARLHFQIIGQGKGYDGAKDILTAGAVKDYIYDSILPALKDEALQSGTVFGQFIKPEEFANDLLQGLNPEDEENWQQTLKDLGLEDFTGGLEELKTYIMETLSTGSAQKIREQIKYLNEKRKKPTQENLGVTYIEREEDYNPEQLEGETELYKVFQNAGFKGSEDEFYENFMPDINREDQAFLSSAGSGKQFNFNFGDYSDPFKSLSSIQAFFPTQEDDDEETKTKKDSLFDLSLDIDKVNDYKSKTSKSFLGDFTSGFNFF